MSSSEFATTSAHQPLGKRDIHIQMQDTSPEAIQTLLEEVQFSWHETLGVPPKADAATVRSGMVRLALAYHPDKGGSQAQMARINGAYEKARTAL